MKRKIMLVRPRNPLVAPAKFRKAGAHGKSEKALRRAAKMEIQEGCWPRGCRHLAFTQAHESSSLSQPTIDFIRMLAETAPGAGSGLLHSAASSRMQSVFHETHNGVRPDC